MADDFVLQVLSFFSDHDLHDSLWWRTDGEYAPVTFFAKTSDVLSWGMADCEPVTPETLPLLQAAVADCVAVGERRGALCGIELFACRIARRRPQEPAYPQNRDLWPLFDACGPE